MERITNVQIEEFLKDFEENSITEILEDGKEKNEVVAIAKAKGINLKANKDLAGFKTIYTFANKANKNNARLPKKALLKALPSMIGKPVDIDHQRRYVVGHYIDYRYKAKEDMVVAYGVFYKSNFGEEWEEAKKLFKKHKLATSYEIWCPEDKRRELSDGTYELLQQEIAGGALLFKEEPAFKDAKVLELAKKNSQAIEEDLIFAKKYKDSELIICKDNVCETLSCQLDGSSTIETKVETIDKPKETPKIKCSNCEEEFEYGGIGDIKCPKCFAILNKTGLMIYPPQIKDFKIMCPSCKVNRWLILNKCEKGAKLRCLHCSKEYRVMFGKQKINELAQKMDFVYIGRASCLQCGKVNDVVGTSAIKLKTIKCKRCGLEYSYDITQDSQKQIAKIEEIKKEQTSEKGGQKTKEFKVETSKFHRYVDDIGKLEATIPDDYGESTEVAKRLTTEQRNALPDSSFAVVVRVKNKRTGKMRKIRMFPINDEAHVRNALARLGQPAPQATLKRLGVSIEKVRAKILRRARQLKMKELLKRYEKSSEEKMEKKETKKEVEVKEEKVESKVEEQPIAEETPKAEGKPKAEETPKAEEAPKTEEKPEVAQEEKKETPVEEEPKVEEKAKVEEPKVEKTEEKKDEKVETPKEEKKIEVKTEKVEEPKKETSKEEKPEESVEEAKETKEQKYAKGIRKLASQIKELKKALKIAKDEKEKEIAFYKANAEEINARRKELGEHAKDLTDKQILEDENYAKAKANMENANIETSAKVGDKDANDDEHYKQLHKKIDGMAFGRTE